MTLLGALALLVVQVLIFLVLGARAGIRYRKGRPKHLDACDPQANIPLRQRLLARLPASRGLRAVSFLLFLLALVMMGSALIMALAWWRASAATPQASLRQFAALTSLPYLALMMLAALPALAAALEVLLRLKRRQGAARGSLFYCLFAFVYSPWAWWLLAFTTTIAASRWPIPGCRAWLCCWRQCLGCSWFFCCGTCAKRALAPDLVLVRSGCLWYSS